LSAGAPATCNPNRVGETHEDKDENDDEELKPGNLKVGNRPDMRIVSGSSLGLND